MEENPVTCQEHMKIKAQPHLFLLLIFSLFTVLKLEENRARQHGIAKSSVMYLALCNVTLYVFIQK